MQSLNVSSLLRPVPYMGVVHVVKEASKPGFRNSHPDWCNLGQTQPEGPMKAESMRCIRCRVEVVRPDSMRSNWRNYGRHSCKARPGTALAPSYGR